MALNVQAAGNLITGKTFPIKHHLKAIGQKLGAGLKWDPDKKAWTAKSESHAQAVVAELHKQHGQPYQQGAAGAPAAKPLPDSGVHPSWHAWQASKKADASGKAEDHEAAGKAHLAAHAATGFTTHQAAAKEHLDKAVAKLQAPAPDAAPSKGPSAKQLMEEAVQASKTADASGKSSDHDAAAKAHSKAYAMTGDPAHKVAAKSHLAKASEIDQAAKPPAPTASSANILHQKLEGAKGSNAGGVYQGADGVKRYVKHYSDPKQAIGEHLANAVYRGLGHAAPKSTLFEHNGKTAYASEWQHGLQTMGHAGITPQNAAAALHGFAADVLTSNWDAAGQSHDNFNVDSGGVIHRIDNGGSFLHRAQGDLKPADQLHKLTELHNLLPGGNNPAYAQVAKAAGVTSQEHAKALVGQQLPAIDALKAQHGGWAGFVAKHVGDHATPEHQHQLAGMLEARHAALHDFAGTSPAAVAKAADGGGEPTHHKGQAIQVGPKGGKFIMLSSGKKLYLSKSADGKAQVQAVGEDGKPIPKATKAKGDGKPKSGLPEVPAGTPLAWKSGVASHEGMALNGVALKALPKDAKPWEPAQGFQEKHFGEPPMNAQGMKAGAGVVVLEPDGKIWIVEPKDHYGGVKNTYPKGGQDKGHSLQQTAIKEALEESGLHVELTGHLGDYKGETSVARYYLAKRVGGAPWGAHWETQGVRLATPDEAKALLNKPRDQQILGDLQKHIASGKAGVDASAVKAAKAAAAAAKKQESAAAKQAAKAAKEAEKQAKKVAANAAKLAKAAKDAANKAAVAFKGIKIEPQKATKEEMNQVFDKKWEASLSGPGKSALQSYTGHGYIEMNDGLREHQGDLSKLSSHTASKIRDLDKVLTPPPGAFKDLALVRNVSTNPAKNFGVHSFQVGGVFHDPGYGSASIHGETFDHKDIRIEIAVPKGHGGAWADAAGVNTGEREFLLPRGTHFLVHSIEKQGGKHVIKATAVGSSSIPEFQLKPPKKPKVPKPKADNAAAPIALAS